MSDDRNPFARRFTTRLDEVPGAVVSRADLQACVSTNVPPCPDCVIGQPVAIEITGGGWQLLCLSCLGRWELGDWKPEWRYPRARADDSSDPVAVAYGAPPVDPRLDERFRIAHWLRQLDAVSLLGRRTVSVITVAEAVAALADAIRRGEHENEEQPPRRDCADLPHYGLAPPHGECPTIRIPDGADPSRLTIEQVAEAVGGHVLPDGSIGFDVRASACPGVVSEHDRKETLDAE